MDGAETTCRGTTITGGADAEATRVATETIGMVVVVVVVATGTMAVVEVEACRAMGAALKTTKRTVSPIT